MSSRFLTTPRKRAISWRAVAFFGFLSLAAWVHHNVDSAPVARADEASGPAASDPSAEAQHSDSDSHKQSDVHSQPAGDHNEHGDADHGEGEHGEGSHGEEHSGGHKDPVAEILLGITVILLAAKVTGDLFERIHMPAVLGELTIGILLGNWHLLTGSEYFDFLKADITDASALTGNVLDMLSRIGVVLLLFEVGLESRVKDMMSVGVSSLLVALLGVVAPMVLGFGVGYLLLSESSAEWQVPAFLGATLCATSVGITARVIKDMGRNQDRESKIILGAAVIDDVLGLVVLAIVSGVIQKGADFEVMSLFKIVGLSFMFLAVSLGLGVIQLPRTLFRWASYLHGHGMLVVTALVICFSFSYAANMVGLAPIIGAFAAGLILEGTHYQDVGDKWRHHHLEEALSPLSALMVPIFFVVMGMSVNLSAFGDSSVWLLATGLTVVAILGKLACYCGVTEKGLNRLAVGLGMIPRGEVGLIFAAEGKRLFTATGERVINDSTFSAIVVMVMITTMVTPPLLKWAMSKSAPPAST
ncbi:MAG: cation:proton antiporter [Planctomycetaceae bacterium]|nr:cation:proton antiporter [Planctomycetaceae bacterium]